MSITQNRLDYLIRQNRIEDREDYLEGRSKLQSSLDGRDSNGEAIIDLCAFAFILNKFQKFNKKLSKNKCEIEFEITPNARYNQSRISILKPNSEFKCSSRDFYTSKFLPSVKWGKNNFRDMCKKINENYENNFHAEVRFEQYSYYRTKFTAKFKVQFDKSILDYVKKVNYPFDHFRGKEDLSDAYDYKQKLNDSVEYFWKKIKKEHNSYRYCVQNLTLEELYFLFKNKRKFMFNEDCGNFEYKDVELQAYYDVVTAVCAEMIEKDVNEKFNKDVFGFDIPELELNPYGDCKSDVQKMKALIVDMKRKIQNLKKIRSDFRRGKIDRIMGYMDSVVKTILESISSADVKKLGFINYVYSYCGPELNDNIGEIFKKYDGVIPKYIVKRVGKKVQQAIKLNEKLGSYGS